MKDAPVRRSLRGRVTKRLGLRKDQAAGLGEARSLRPGDVPDVPLRVPPAEAAAPERLRRLLEQVDAVDRLQRLVDRLHVGERLEVDSDREATETVRRRAKLRLVVLRVVQAEHDPVRALERPMMLVALGRLGPAEVTEELRHPLDVPARERDQADARGESHQFLASAQLSPTPTSTASAGSRSYAPHISARTSSFTFETSTSGTSSRSSSCTWRTSRALLPSSPSLRAIRIIAILMMSAFEPCMTKLTATRSPKPRVWRFDARSSGTGRRRPSNEVT